MTQWTDEQRTEFEKWCKLQKPVHVDESQLAATIRSDLQAACGMSSKEYTLWRTWQQVRDEFDPKDRKTLRRIQKTKLNIWSPEDPYDFERLEPELVYVQHQFPIPSVSIWGTERTRFLSNPDPLSDDWEHLRHFVSAMEHGGNLGRSFRFLVRDSVTKKYLGIICIAGDFANLKGRDDAIGWHKISRKSGIPDRLNNTAIASVLVPTQPLGFSYLGGKLMTLLALSKPVASMWEKLYGDTLVGITTTSLYAKDRPSSQYDGLGKYMKGYGVSTGETALRPDRAVLETMKQWMLAKHPEAYWEYFVAKRESGQPMRRNANEYARLFCYQKLGIKKDEYISGHSRGIYFSKLYQNAFEFLRGEISENDLTPNFDNSVENLVSVWRDKCRKRVDNLVHNGTFSNEPLFMDGLIGATWEDSKRLYLR